MDLNDAVLTDQVASKLLLLVLNKSITEKLEYPTITTRKELMRHPRAYLIGGRHTIYEERESERSNRTESLKGVGSERE